MERSDTQTMQTIRDSGLKVTESRIRVLEAVQNMPHSSAETIYNNVRRQLSATSVQTIYGVLDKLNQVGLIRKIEPAGSAALYEADHHDNHHHAVCRQCGAVTDIACTTGSAPCLHPNDFHGFTIDEAEVVFWGLCPQCQTTGSQTASQTEATTP